MDAKLYTYGVNKPPSRFIESLSATTLRNIIGEMEWTTLTSRDTINSKDHGHP